MKQINYPITMKRILPIAVLAVAAALPAAAQHDASYAAEDARQRGYYDRPYLRYEAEEGACDGQLKFLNKPGRYRCSLIQTEASNCRAASLVKTGDYVEWTADADANAMTLRFSLPDGDGGQGRQTTLALYVDDTKMCDINLDSYWAWQWMYSGWIYPDNTPATDGKFARMYFDEVNVLLPGVIHRDSHFRLVREANIDFDITIDFVELEMAPEPVRFEDIADANKVKFTGRASDINRFVQRNGGKTIYFEPGVYDIPDRMYIPHDGTKIVGAGMWYTTFNFTQSSDTPAYWKRGIYSNASNLVVEGISLTTVNNKRYYQNIDSQQVGKGFMGSFGRNSVIRGCRVDHFECGGWIADYDGVTPDGLQVSYCRFRNNYADGFNLSSGSTNCAVTHCSFRNNGDDDQATWSSNINVACNGNMFAYNTAENNWRASSLGFFGGNGHKAHHIVIADAMDCGARVNCDFPGSGFGDTECSFTDITLLRSGGVDRSAEIGGFWGGACPAVQIKGQGAYGLRNIRVENIDVIAPKWQGVAIQGGSIEGLELHNIYVDGDGNDQLGISILRNTTGYGHYSSLVAENCKGVVNFSRVAPNFNFVEDASFSGVDRITPAAANTTMYPGRGAVGMGGLVPGTAVTVFTLTGMVAGNGAADENGNAVVENLAPGMYILTGAGTSRKILIY